MAYKFNSGLGGVICDNCRVLIDSDLSFKTYEEVYGKDGNNGDFCWRCKTGYKEKKDSSIAQLVERHAVNVNVASSNLAAGAKERKVGMEDKVVKKRGPRMCKSCGVNPAGKRQVCDYDSEIPPADPADIKMCTCCDECRDKCAEDI